MLPGVYERSSCRMIFAITISLTRVQDSLPRTGLKSITIMSPNATDADAFLTGVFLMGPEEGMAYLEALPEDVEAFFITDDNKIYATSGIRERLKLTDPTYSFAIIKEA